MQFVTMVALASTLSTLGAQAQDGPTTITPKMAARLSDAIDAAMPATHQSQSFIEIGADIGAALGAVDQDELNRLGGVLNRLQRETLDLERCLDRLDQGKLISIPRSTISMDAEEPATENLLREEEATLAALKVQHAGLAEEQAAKRRHAMARAKAPRLTSSSTALMAAIESLPALNEAPAQEVTPVSTRWPQRTARALFATGDYVGALRHFDSIKKETLTDGDIYNMARCLEELTDFKRASTLAGELEVRAHTPFWRERARAFKEYLTRQGRIQRFLEKK